MRRIVFVLVGVALLGSSWFCSSDAPSPTPPRVNTPGPSGSSPLQIRLFTSNANPIAGSCTAIQALVTLNGVNVPDGTGVSLTTDLANSVFQQNLLPLISVVTQGGIATTALCSTSTGLATVRATSTIGSNTGTATIQIAFQPSPQVAPFFTFCTPSFGPATGGTTLQINGGRFFGTAQTTRATFTALGVTREALVTGVTDTTVTVVTPAFPEANTSSVPVTINVTFGNNTSTPVTLSLPNCFAYGTASSATPTITAVVPSTGSNEGNTLVSIFGSGFVAPLQVFFGPVEAKVVSVSFNQIIVSTPPASGAGLPNLNATVAVRVHEVNSGQDATLSSAFRFVTALQITAIDNGIQRVDAPFTAVTIHGQGFLAPVAVTLAGVPAKVISVSATELLVLPGTPFLSACSDLSGPVVVTNIDSGDTKSGGTFTYQVVITKPAITSISPASGPPGSSVTITGTNLGNITSVTVGGKPAPITSPPTSTTVTITIPDNGATAPACPAGTAAGTLISVGNPVDVTVSSSLTTCSASASGTFQYQLPCKPGADLALTKTASPNPVFSGAVLTYTIQVNNGGPNAATNAVVLDPLPGGVTFVSCSSTQGTCGITGGTVTANLGTINSPGFAIVTIQVTVTAPSGTTITNTAVVSSDTPDTNTANNQASATALVSGGATPTPTGGLGTPTVTPAATADLVLSKTASQSSVISGSTLTYQLNVTNNKPGSGTATGVVVTDPLPVGTTFQSCTTSQGSCAGPAIGSNGTVTATLGSIPSPGFAIVTIVVTVTAPGGTTVINTGVVNSVTVDTDISNNTASVSVSVTPAPAGADLSVVKTASAGQVESGGVLTYFLTVTNGGPDPASAVLVTDQIPSGTTFVSCSTPVGTCTGPAVGTNGLVTANLGTVPALAPPITVTITVNVTAPNGSTLVNTGTVSSPTTDPNPANNSSTNVTQVNPTTADLAITKSDAPDPVTTGGTLTYTLSVNNLGAGPSNAIVASDTLPAGVSFVSCTTTQGVCTFSSGTVTATLGTLAASSGATVSIVVTVTAPGGTVLTNTATVTSSTTDPNPGNNSSTTTTTVSP